MSAGLLFMWCKETKALAINLNVKSLYKADIV